MLLSEQERRRIRDRIRIARLTDLERKQLLAKKAKVERDRWAARNPDRVRRKFWRTKRSETKSQCLSCLYRCGLGRRRISRILRENDGWVKNRIRPTDKSFNRWTIRNRGLSKKTLLGNVLRVMRTRARRCLNRKPPKPLSPVAGMSPSDSFRWHYRNDPGFRLMQLCRRRARKLLAGVKTVGVHTRLVGCSSDHLRLHIQRQFKPGMNWNNYGKWHLDHIIPCSAFDLTREDQQRICFNWTNLRPLWSRENLQKSNKLEKHETPQFAL